MRRTFEQIAADEALTAALNRNIEAYGRVSGVVGDYIIAAAVTDIDENGDLDTTVALLASEGHLPRYRASGLIDELCDSLERTKDCTCED